MAGSAATLHITNGDAVLYLFKKAGMPGTHIAWRDALHEGPVPADFTLEQTSALRAPYLASRGYGNPIKIIHDFQSRDAQLLRAGEFEEVVLWFEHDLYDQLQLLQVLTSMEHLSLEPERVSLVQSDQYLGLMSADEINALYPRRRAATPAIARSANRAWERFTSPAWEDLFAAAQEDAIGLPFLRAALLRLCEEYPWANDGLSRSQRHALEAVSRGPARDEELFRRAQAREEAPFMGDRIFGIILRELQTVAAPLVEGEEGALVPTLLGRRVLAGDADWLESVTLDRWIGGVHLNGDHAARWDGDRSRFVGQP
jgi:hypothetical protein